MFDIKLFNPINQMKVASWFVNKFYSIVPKIGMFLSGEFGPKINPLPFFFGFFFYFIPRP